MEALTWANNKLKDHHDRDPANGKGLDSPMLDAQLLMAFVLDVSKSYLFTHFDQKLREEQLEKFESFINRRIHHEPIAYILGWKEFYKRPFRINHYVLVPRPDTETLIDEAIARSKNSNDTLFIDVGTGSGAISITLAAETSLPVIATEVSARTLAVAENNAKINKVKDRVTFLHGNLIDPIDPKMIRGIDQVILCANLPYLTTKQWELTQPEVHDYEPRLALDGGVDGLVIYHELFQSIALRRKEFPANLTTIIEIDPNQQFSAVRLIEHHFPHAKNKVIKDLADKPRLIISEL